MQGYERDVIVAAPTAKETVHVGDQAIDNSLRSMRCLLGKDSVETFLAILLAFGVERLIDTVGVKQQAVTGL